MSETFRKRRVGKEIKETLKACSPATMEMLHLMIQPEVTKKRIRKALSILRSNGSVDMLIGGHQTFFYQLSQSLPMREKLARELNCHSEESSATARVAFPGCAPYASMKGGINVLARYLAKELGGRKIRVNAIAPGAIRTDLGGGLDGASEFVKQLTEMTALRRIGDPIDVARAVASLFSEDSQWVNGQTIEISGGMTL
ncbi:MAG: SDR family oxidoreductase [Proteobacteria bacterium]|nr:MAG: SDR family oxidoreductase [Pseudomonadota bacterium]